MDNELTGNIIGYVYDAENDKIKLNYEKNENDIYYIELLSGNIIRATYGEEALPRIEKFNIEYDIIMDDETFQYIELNFPEKTIELSDDEWAAYLISKTGAPDNVVREWMATNQEPAATVFPRKQLSSQITTTIKLGDEVIEKVNGSNYEYYLEKNGTYTVTAIAEDGSKGKKTITIEGKNDAIGASFYGEKVVSSGTADGQINIPNITGNWNLFYADKDNAYLIYDDYYPTLAQPGKDNDTILGYAYTISTQMSGTRETLINYMKNQSNWEIIKNAFCNAGYGNNIKVTGSPTLGMWIASFNSVYNTNLEHKYFRGNRGEANANGFKLKLSSEKKWDYRKGVDMTQFNDNNVSASKEKLYFPHEGWFDQGEGHGYCEGYWLASPSAQDTSRLMTIDRSNSDPNYNFCMIDYDYCNYTNHALRPVVQIPKEDFRSVNEALYNQIANENGGIW